MKNVSYHWMGICIFYVAEIKSINHIRNNWYDWYATFVNMLAYKALSREMDSFKEGIATVPEVNQCPRKTLAHTLF